MNAIDRYAVAVIKNKTIIGHMPRKVSKIFLYGEELYSDRRLKVFK